MLEHPKVYEAAVEYQSKTEFASELEEQQHDNFVHKLQRGRPLRDRKKSLSLIWFPHMTCIDLKLRGIPLTRRNTYMYRWLS
eukprot:5044935-Karenia_brevis.AAC.1